jgi:hypothetical protein
MSLEAALAYASHGWPVFPINGKKPLTTHGYRDASTDRATIVGWWRRWPKALVGFPTGRIDRIVVLDVDIKHPPINGFDTLEDLGYAVLPVTPMAHTPSGGVHLYFTAPDHVEIRNTCGAPGRGIGAGLDWRGTGGSITLPTLGSGYRWDPLVNPNTVKFAPVPADLLPRQPAPGINIKPVQPVVGLSPYGEAALDSATKRILHAPRGEQEATLNAECFAIGTLAGAGALPADFARRVMKWAALRIRSYDSRRPWTEKELKEKVDRAFDAGMRQPRRARR